MNMQWTQRTIRFVLLLTVGGALDLFGTFAYPAESPTGCYSLVPQKRDDGSLIEPAPVCVALTRNLNQFCDSAPHVCSIPISPGCAGLSAPKWTTLDPARHFSLLERLVKGTWAPNRQTDAKGMQRVIDESLSTYRTALSEGRLKVSESRFDMANGYGPEPVYRVDTGQCETELAQWRRQPRLRSYGEATGNVPTPEQENVRATFLQQSDPILYPQRAAEIADGTRPLKAIYGGGETFQGRTFAGFLGTALFHDHHTFYVVWISGRDCLLVIESRPSEPAGFLESLCEIQYHFPHATPAP